MNQLQKFILRAVLGVVFSYVLCQIFRPEAGLFMIIILAAFLVALSYVLEYLRRRKP